MDTPEVTSAIMNPIIQWGFAGLCIVLMGVIVWLIRELLTILKETNNIIAANTQAIQTVDSRAKSTLDVAIEVKDELLKRPCIARFNVGK